MPKYFEHSASPFYAQVTNAMPERIVKGLWPIGTQIPTLPVLSPEFDVGLSTIRQAV
jgi:DNA-binding GntR family transcriptional regulator